METDFSALAAEFSRLSNTRRVGRVASVGAATIEVEGLTRHARIGDQVEVASARGERLGGEVVALDAARARAMAYGPIDGVAVGDAVALTGRAGVHPDISWTGRVVDAFGQPLDGRPLRAGAASADPRAAAPAPATRKGLGARLATGLAVFDTMLPLARGQRIGIFAGSGVGKSTLLADLARGIEADVVVLALIGERGRELRDFVDHVLGPEGMARSVVIAATSDQAPLIKRRAAWMAMAVAETFRDQGRHVLLLIDSLTRFAEAHREIALTTGEAPSLRGFPPSVANLIAALCERAGPGPSGKGDITGVFSVLVAGSDMEEPVADIARGVLDGHVVLDRDIAERGRFPAVDVRRSVSRSLPRIASAEENVLILRARRILTTYENAALMIRTGLYVAGSDPAIDEAARLWPALDACFTERSPGVDRSFARLGEILEGTTAVTGAG
ncbi:FliI/YscN family ATPase [Amaricoccus solimangrovi]|uniref:FliI/YscN family ATPase n=1 Tax=Amaricoccus solimangrovi TaxID=2589815 RepID=A0A501WUS9_9RHOB|nr:FliI/YscN family ATPase [Amaricoccus solimangrovi]TPE52492.1 FliI/YscN family ATPase [Amaricoccus solimangrovi]